MSDLSWKTELTQMLKQLRKDNPEARIAVMGIGNTLNSDDAAGVLAVQAFQSLCAERDSVLAIDGGAAPESSTSVLRRFEPDLVIMIDACFLDLPPGTITWVPWEQSKGLSASTHTLPLNILATFLIHDLGCRIALLGIQPAELGLGKPNQIIVDAAQSIADELCAQISGFDTHNARMTPKRLQRLTHPLSMGPGRLDQYRS